MQKQIWTFGYRPMVMGGNVHYILAATVEVGPPVSLGKGFKGHVIKVPGTRKTRVIESTTGAIIGDTINGVRKDVATSNKKTMTDQVARAAYQLKSMTVETVKPKDFWATYLK